VVLGDYINYIKQLLGLSIKSHCRQLEVELSNLVKLNKVPLRELIIRRNSWNINRGYQ